MKFGEAFGWIATGIPALGLLGAMLGGLLFGSIGAGVGFLCGAVIAVAAVLNDA